MGLIVHFKIILLYLSFQTFVGGNFSVKIAGIYGSLHHHQHLCDRGTIFQLRWEAGAVFHERPRKLHAVNQGNTEVSGEFYIRNGIVDGVYNWS